ncbi:MULTISPECIES: spore germination protein GerPE [Bacillus]|uniref:spore germination protein GerPE n=1 Tax=Bacillus TaxID=1386 RepID=UPI00037376BD|nr:MULTISPECIES: spore germination protein GerPE [Bacillus]
MLSRTSQVNFIEVTSILFSSNLQIGDTKYINGQTIILAEQHEAHIFTQKKEQEITDLANFSPIPPFPTIFENFTTTTFNKKNKIFVDWIDIGVVSAASILAVGNSDHVRMISQVDNIRHLDLSSHESNKKI